MLFIVSRLYSTSDCPIWHSKVFARFPMSGFALSGGGIAAPNSSSLTTTISLGTLGVAFRFIASSFGTTFT